MSRENMEIVRSACELFNDEVFNHARELDLRAFDSDIELDNSSAMLDAAVYRGRIQGRPARAARRRIAADPPGLPSIRALEPV